MAHVCNPSTLGGRDGKTTWAQEFKTSLGNMAKPHLYKKYNLAPACSLRYLGGWDGMIAWGWEAEAAVSWDCATILQPGQQSETLPRKKKDNAIIIERSAKGEKQN